MKKQRFKAYGININKEYKTYRNIGKDYGNSKTADKGKIANFIRFCRKIFNKNQTKYAVCNTYTEWKNHVKSILPKDIINYEDFLHWLYYYKSDSEDGVEFIKVIQIPMDIGLISLIIQIYNPEKITIESVIVGVIIAVVISVIFLSNALEKVRFYEDFIQICERMFSENSKV